MSRTRVAIWSHRGDTIRSSDIVKADPLRIQLGSTDSILQTRVLAVSRTQAGVKITTTDADPTAVFLNFDFLDPGDGAIVEIMHQGAEAGEILGTIQGVSLKEAKWTSLAPKALNRIGVQSRFRRLWNSVNQSRDARIDAALRLIACIFGLAGGIYLIASYVKPRGQLVDPSGFNLKTLSGQTDFANKIYDVGIDRRSGFFEGIGIVTVATVLIFLAWTFYVSTRFVIPPTVVSIRLDSPTSLLDEGQPARPPARLEIPVQEEK